MGNVCSPFLFVAIKDADFPFSIFHFSFVISGFNLEVQKALIQEFICTV
jgi:hypothetical protein